MSGHDPTQRPDRVGEIFDAAWEARARQALEDSGYDPDLAVEVARDAFRVVTGELEEDEFQERYRETYLDTFGRDERPRIFGGSDAPSTEHEAGMSAHAEAPVGPGDDGRAEGSKESAPPALLSRRSALRLAAGAGAAALFLGEMISANRRPTSFADEPGHGAASAGGAAAAGGRRVRMGMVIDTEKCDGCLLCVGGCKQFNGLPDGVHWIYVLAYQEPEDAADAVRLLPRVCQHCENAPCVMVCPTAARYRRDDGIVLTDYERCIGCRYCQISCPYAANYFQWTDPELHGSDYVGEVRDVTGRPVEGDPPRGVMGKCTFHPLHADHQHRQPMPPCALACPHDVIHYGDLNDPNSAPNRYLAQRREERGGTLPTFRLLEDLGTEPNVIYIGSPPSSRAEAVKGPATKEDWGLVDERRALLEPPEAWFQRAVRRS